MNRHLFVALAGALLSNTVLFGCSTDDSATRDDGETHSRDVREPPARFVLVPHVGGTLCTAPDDAESCTTGTAQPDAPAWTLYEALSVQGDMVELAAAPTREKGIRTCATSWSVLHDIDLTLFAPLDSLAPVATEAVELAFDDDTRVRFLPGTPYMMGADNTGRLGTGMWQQAVDDVPDARFFDAPAAAPAAERGAPMIQMHAFKVGDAKLSGQALKPDTEISTDSYMSDAEVEAQDEADKARANDPSQQTDADLARAKLAALGLDSGRTISAKFRIRGVTAGGAGRSLVKVHDACVEATVDIPDEALTHHGAQVMGFGGFGAGGINSALLSGQRPKGWEVAEGAKVYDAAGTLVGATRRTLSFFDAQQVEADGDYMCFRRQLFSSDADVVRLCVARADVRDIGGS